MEREMSNMAKSMMKQADETAMSRIVSDPDICAGRPTIRGTRVRVSDILDMIADGASSAEILGDFKYLTEADIRAALADENVGEYLPTPTYR